MHTILCSASSTSPSKAAQLKFKVRCNFTTSPLADTVAFASKRASSAIHKMSAWLGAAKIYRPTVNIDFRNLRARPRAELN